MKSSNPAFGERVWSQVRTGAAIEDAMTVQGAANKAITLLGLLTIGAAWTWFAVLRDPATAAIWMWVGVIGGTILALVTIFKTIWAPISSQSPPRTSRAYSEASRAEPQAV